MRRYVKQMTRQGEQPCRHHRGGPGCRVARGQDEEAQTFNWCLVRMDEFAVLLNYPFRRRSPRRAIQSL